MPGMTSQTDLLELARHLRQEHLFVTSEKQQLQNLNEKVLKTVEKLYHLAWITRHQRLNLENLILARSDWGPAACCQRANSLDMVGFVDSYRHLGVHDSLYAEFLQQLREESKLLALCLDAGEKVNPDNLQIIVNIITSALYGNSVIPEDEIHVLRLLRELMVLQLATCDNLRRLLQHGSCSFSRVYKSFTEGLFSAKLFLTSALHSAILQVLMEDDLFLDIDPSKAVIRFPSEERQRHFGREGSPEYTAKLQKYRSWTINKLTALTNHFIEGIRNSMYCFPHSLSWLVRQMYTLVMKACRVEVRQVGAMCADLVFAFFICPAIVNPELYGITDAHISIIARFNLMQIAQILQVLAMAKWEDIDPKLMDLYEKFEKDCMSSILDFILEGSSEESPAEFNFQLQELTRSAILITESDLYTLVSFLRKVLAETQNDIIKKNLTSMLNNLPNTPTTVSNCSTATTPQSNTPTITPPQTPSLKKGLLGKVSKSRSKSGSTLPLPPSEPEEANSNHSDLESQQPEEVLVIPLSSINFDCPGMLSEEKALSLEQQKRHTRVRMNLDNLASEEVESITSGPETVEKRTRFSLSQDQESLGTSDNLEAISEAASNHSVASSLDMENENENDNLSDMVSANVSGHGTPNVSGRDTPSSQVEGEERELRPLELTLNAQKQNQADIEDKFGKFEITPVVEADETKSMVSDTWSTDVLASDSETVEQGDLASQIRSLEPQLNLLHQPAMLPDLSETASDAWSTDVVASDTERLQEFDTDDTASVARSDDTRSEVEGEAAAGGDQSDDALLMLERRRSAGNAVSNRLLDPSSPEHNLVKSVAGDGGTFPQVQVTMIGDAPLMPTSALSGRKKEAFSTNSGCSSTNDNQQDTTGNNDFATDIPLNADIRMFDPIAVDVDLKSNCSGGLLGCEDITPTGTTATPSPNSIQEALHGMQSLGRLSFAMKELPEQEDQIRESLLVSLQGTAASAGDSPAALSNLLSGLPTAKPPEPSSPLSATENTIEFEKIIGIDSEESLVMLRTRGDQTLIQSGSQELYDPNIHLSTTSISSTSSASSTDMNTKLDVFVPQGESRDSKEYDTPTMPLPSTGAIPKSISFDRTADKSFRDTGDDKTGDKNRRSFFKNKVSAKLSGFRFSFKPRNRKSDDYQDRSDRSQSGIYEDAARSKHHRTYSHDPSMSNSDAVDNILEKYRTPKSSSSTSEKTSSHPEAGDGQMEGTILDDEQNIHLPGSESNFAFTDAKRKLRMVLGLADVQLLSYVADYSTRLYSNGRLPSFKVRDNELVAFLKMLLAEAINLQQKSLVTNLHEALRCVKSFDEAGCQRLLRSLKEDYKRRSPYIAYLIRCRQGLLSTLAYLENLIQRIQRDKCVCSSYLVTLCTRHFLEKKERNIQFFVKKFQELTVADEKAQLVEKFLQYLFLSIEVDQAWQMASDQQLKLAQKVIERTIMSQIYVHALYPNGDGDVLRDQVLTQHIQKLSKIISVNHKDLRIPKIYHHECPWPSAQAEIIAINAYKSPGDKIQCVVSCCSTIMNLLSMASDKSVPAADDLMPVLVYVLIKANPPFLLSTVQYVNTFHEKHLKGESAYWWTQFCSAVEFIKTMDY